TIFCTPKTSCNPAATKNRTAAWKTPPTRMFAKATIYALHRSSQNLAQSRCEPAGSRSDLELRSLDPVPEVGSRRLLQIGGVHGLKRAERDEVVFVVMRREALHEGLLGDVILAPGAFAAETFHRQADHGVNDVILGRPTAILGRRSFFHRRLVGRDGKIG